MENQSYANKTTNVLTMFRHTFWRLLTSTDNSIVRDVSGLFFRAHVLKQRQRVKPMPTIFASRNRDGISDYIGLQSTGSTKRLKGDIQLEYGKVKDSNVYNVDVLIEMWGRLTHLKSIKDRDLHRGSLYMYQTGSSWITSPFKDRVINTEQARVE